MRLAIFSDTFPPQTNGVANVASQSAQELSRRGHQVMVFTASSTPRPVEPLAQVALRYYPSLPAPSYPGERLATPVSLSGLRQIKKFRPDLIHSHTPFSLGFAAVLAARLTHAPLIGTHHTFFDHYLRYVHLDTAWGQRFSWRYTVSYYNRCTLVLSPTQSLATALTQHGLKRPVQLLANPINTTLFRQPTSSERQQAKKSWRMPAECLVYLGRLSYEKSIDQVIRVFANLLQTQPRLTLLIIGDGPERKHLEQLAQKLRVADSIRFTGFLHGPALRSALWAGDIFITASQTENMPLAVLEAMATGLPIVAPCALGLPELVTNGVEGLLSEPDALTGLVNSVERLLRAPALRAQFGQNAQLRAQQYSVAKVTDRLEAIYQEILTL